MGKKKQGKKKEKSMEAEKDIAPSQYVESKKIQLIEAESIMLVGRSQGRRYWSKDINFQLQYE